MTTYTWPTTWKPTAFEMRPVPNVRAYGNPFAPSSTQVTNLAGCYWTLRMTLPLGISDADGAEKEAFLARLYGPTHKVAIPNLKRPVPRGTLRDGTVAAWNTTAPATATWTTASAAAVTWYAGQPALASAMAQYATTGTIKTVAGRTLLAGDMFAIGTQTVMQLVDTVADGSGNMSIEFTPEARQSFAAYTAVSWNRPTVNFRLRGDVPVVWEPGIYLPIELDLIEAT